ncbi:hypothetical protein [Acetivibrio clariflavus]|nr:hypothetical protein [Acetivibrio clariflavus]
MGKETRDEFEDYSGKSGNSGVILGMFIHAGTVKKHPTILPL